jgi:hypothetical protein
MFHDHFIVFGFWLVGDFVDKTRLKNKLLYNSI